uniref:Photoactivated adenylate cyclase subunit alpha-like protein FB n=1 Tax=Lygus hesperus TaxID=30085 RepID=A0A0A9W2P0_LYGHE
MMKLPTAVILVLTLCAFAEPAKLLKKQKKLDNCIGCIEPDTGYWDVIVDTIKDNVPDFDDKLTLAIYEKFDVGETDYVVYQNSNNEICISSFLFTPPFETSPPHFTNYKVSCMPFIK